MKKHCDPGIDEVRAARDEISARYGHDADKMIADHMKQQQRFADRLVWPPTAKRRRRVARARLVAAA
jgi:hypothetical protein